MPALSPPSLPSLDEFKHGIESLRLIRTAVTIQSRCVVAWLSIYLWDMVNPSSSINQWADRADIRETVDEHTTGRVRSYLEEAVLLVESVVLDRVRRLIQLYSVCLLSSEENMEANVSLYAHSRYGTLISQTLSIWMVKADISPGSSLFLRAFLRTSASSEHREQSCLLYLEYPTDLCQRIFWFQPALTVLLSW